MLITQSTEYRRNGIKERNDFMTLNFFDCIGDCSLCQTFSCNDYGRCDYCVHNFYKDVCDYCGFSEVNENESSENSQNQQAMD